MERKSSIWVAIVGLCTGFGAAAMAYHLGRTRHGDRVMEPTYAIPTQPNKLNETELVLLEQALLRIAMNKAPLSAPDMQRTFDLAIKAGLPKTATTIRSIMNDGKISGPNYVPLPTNEAWPGTNVAVRTFVAVEMAKLQAESAKA